MKTLDLVNFKNEQLKSQLENKISFGISKLMQHNAVYIITTSSWNIVFSMLEFSKNKYSTSLKMKALNAIVSPDEGFVEISFGFMTEKVSGKSHVSKENFALCVNTLFTFAKNAEAGNSIIA